MKYTYTFILFLLAHLVIAQEEEELIEKKIKAHFSEFTPEAYRLSEPMYGQSNNTKFSEAQIKKEIELYDEVADSDLIDYPTNDVFALCHNIMIHSPDKGKEFLILLNEETTDKNIINSLFTEFIFAEEFGEQLVLENVSSKNVQWKLTWSKYLKMYAMYDSSIPKIKELIQEQANIQVKCNLIEALINIGNTDSFAFVDRIIDSTSNDSIMSRAIYAYGEFTGYRGISEMEKINTIGPLSAKQQALSVDWFRKNGSSENNYAEALSNDVAFIEKYGDIKSQGMIWLNQHDYLNIKKAQKPKPMSAEDKKMIFDFLLLSNCFELDAIKGNLFLSLDDYDLPTLLKLRAFACYSPNEFTRSRIKTITIMIWRLKRMY